MFKGAKGWAFKGRCSSERCQDAKGHGNHLYLAIVRGHLCNESVCYFGGSNGKSSVPKRLKFKDPTKLIIIPPY